MLKTIFRNITLFIFFGLTTLTVLAQVEIPTNGDPIVVEPFVPSIFTNLRTFGLLRLVGYAAQIFTAYLLGLAIFYVLRIGWFMVVAKGDSGLLEKQKKAIAQLYQGLFMVFGVIGVYSFIGLFMGMGNIFQWPSKLAQCGDGEILFRAEYRAATVNEDIFEKEVLIYCCQRLKVADLDDDTREVALPDGKTAVVGTQDEGGWVFIGDPTEGQDVIPNISDAEACVPYHI